jgi:hypothetical protein
MEGDALPLKEGSGGGKKQEWQDVPLQVANQDRPAGSVVHPAKQFDNFRIVEMMQERGAQDKVEAILGERKAERISQNFRFGGGRKIHGIIVGACDRSVRKSPTDYRSRIPGSGAYIEQRKCLIRSSHASDELSQTRVSTEVGVNPNKICQIPLRLFGFCVIQQLGLNQARSKHGELLITAPALSRPT